MSSLNFPWHSLKLFPLVLHLAAIPFQVAVVSDEDSPESLYLQAFLPSLQAEESFIQMDIYAIPHILSHLKI